MWTGLGSLKFLGKRRGRKRRGGKLREGKGKEEEGREEKGELSAYSDFLLLVQKSVAAKSCLNNARKSMERNITFTCIRAMSRVCYAGKSNVLF